MWIVRTVILLGVVGSLSCGLAGGSSEEARIDCCTCLVNERCVRADEYEFCKDALERGSLQISGLRSLTCDSDACVEAGQCRSVSPNSGSNTDAPPASGGDDPPPWSEPDDPPPRESSATYTLTVVDAEYYESKSNAAVWDGGFGGFRRPDPYVIVQVDGERVGVTRTRQDTFYPEWNERFTVRLSSTSRLTFILMDDDGADDDRAGEYTVTDLDSAIATGGQSVRPSGSVSNLSFLLDP